MGRGLLFSVESTLCRSVDPRLYYWHVTLDTPTWFNPMSRFSLKSIYYDYEYHNASINTNYNTALISSFSLSNIKARVLFFGSHPQLPWDTVQMSEAAFLLNPLVLIASCSLRLFQNGLLSPSLQCADGISLHLWFFFGKSLILPRSTLASKSILASLVWFTLACRGRTQQRSPPRRPSTSPPCPSTPSPTGFPSSAPANIQWR